MNTNTWKVSPISTSDKTPAGRFSHASCVIGKKILFHGGWGFRVLEPPIVDIDEDTSIYYSDCNVLLFVIDIAMIIVHRYSIHSLINGQLVHILNIKLERDLDID